MIDLTDLSPDDALAEVRYAATLPGQLEAQLVRRGLPLPEREVRFHPTRKWRFDLAYPDVKLAIECEGGTWVRGRHSRGKSFEADCEKYAEAVLLEWRILRATTDQVKNGTAAEWVERALKGEHVDSHE